MNKIIITELCKIKMYQINVILDYIGSLLTREPFELDSKNNMYIKLLSILISLEKYHKSIVIIQKRMVDVGQAEKYLRADESNNVIVYCNESLQTKNSMELEFRKKKAIMESKNKLLNVLKRKDLHHRQLLVKSKAEIEQVQIKVNSVHNALDSMLEVYNQIHSQNKINKIKVDGVLVHMKLIEDKLEKRLDDFKLCVKELNKSLTDISKKFSKNEKELIIEQEMSKDIVFNEIHFKNVYFELSKIISSSNQMEEFQPLKTLSQDQISLDLNLIDFHKKYDLANEILLLNIQKNCDTITSINSLLNNLNIMDQTFDSNLKNIGIMINDVLNKRDASTIFLNKLNCQLDELKKNNYSLMVCNQNNDNLIVKCNENISNLENEIHDSNIKLSVTTENNQQLHNSLLNLDSLIHTTYQKTLYDVDTAHQEFLRNNKQPNKVMCLYEKLNTVMNNYNELLVKRKEIIMDQFKRKKSDLDAIEKEHSKKIIGTRNVIKFYKSKMPIYKQFVEQFKDLVTSNEIVKKDLLLIYHGQTLEQLNDEEMKFQSYINSYNKELDEINKEDDYIEKYSKLTELNMNAQIKKLKEKLQLITNANASLEVELNKNKHVYLPSK